MTKLFCIILSLLCGAQSLLADHCPGECKVQGKRVIKKAACNEACPKCDHEECKPCPECNVACMKCEKGHAKGTCPIKP